MLKNKKISLDPNAPDNLLSGALKINEAFDEIGEKLDVAAEVSGELTGKLENVTTQLADTAKKMNKELLSATIRKPMISIIDDDGNAAILREWLPLLESKEFKLDIGVITGYVGNPSYLTWEQLEDLKANYGVDLINHSHTHPMHGDLTEAELREQFEKSTSILRSRGHTSDVYVYPYGSNDLQTRQVARDYVRAAFLDKGGLNVPPLNTFNIRRVLMMDNNTFANVEEMKSSIDTAITNNSWLVFMTHSQFGGFDKVKVAEIIDYANTKVSQGLIEWVHANEGLNRMGNVIDIGDNERDYHPSTESFYIVDSEGKTHSSIEKPIGMLGSRIDFSTPLTDFPINQLSIAYVLNGSPTAGLFPQGSGGTAETFRDGTGNFSYQRYTPTGSNRIYQRSWDVAGKTWGEFSEVGAKIIIDGGATFSSPVSYFKQGVITKSTITADRASGFPEGVGIMETHRFGPESFAHQVHKPSATNNHYARRWTGSAWTTFTPLDKVDTNIYTTVSATVPANSTVDFATNVNIPSANYNAIAMPVGSLEGGLMYCLVNDSAKVIIRFYNATGSTVTVSRQFKIQLVRG